MKMPLDCCGWGWFYRMQAAISNRKSVIIFKIFVFFFLVVVVFVRFQSLSIEITIKFSRTAFWLCVWFIFRCINVKGRKNCDSYMISIACGHAHISFRFGRTISTQRIKYTHSNSHTKTTNWLNNFGTSSIGYVMTKNRDR